MILKGNRKLPGAANDRFTKLIVRIACSSVFIARKMESGLYRETLISGVT